ncbi:MAG: 2-dehydropantoate 2-reductase [Wujia sp.]
MKIYIDFDDVICETARYFTKIAKELFGIVVPYEQVQFFNLQKSFELSDSQYDELMRTAHTPEILLDYEETMGASETINKWVDEGHEVFIITGRPFDSYQSSRKWLDEHNLERIPLFCVDKYGRESFNQDCTYNMTLEKLYSMTFDFVIEDSPAAFEHVLHFNKCKVAVFDRPWNRQAEFPNDNFVRCKDWQEIDRIFELDFTCGITDDGVEGAEKNV